jgi:hypothetical protein
MVNNFFVQVPTQSFELQPMLAKAKGFATSQTGMLLISCFVGFGVLQLLGGGEKKAKRLLATGQRERRSPKRQKELPNKWRK